MPAIRKYHGVGFGEIAPREESAPSVTLGAVCHLRRDHRFFIATLSTQLRTSKPSFSVFHLARARTAGLRVRVS